MTSDCIDCRSAGLGKIARFTGVWWKLVEPTVTPQAARRLQFLSLRLHEITEELQHLRRLYQVGARSSSSCAPRVETSKSDENRRGLVVEVESDISESFLLDGRCRRAQRQACAAIREGFETGEGEREEGVQQPTHNPTPCRVAKQSAQTHQPKTDRALWRKGLGWV